METGVDDPLESQVLAELKRMQEKKTNWKSAIIVLGATAILFLMLGAARWDMQLVLLLIVILFVHELGHYIAMVAFKYRNVRMFFIPLLGAAVIGRRYNVPGWKKSIVSLAGPLPGIAIGAVLGVAGLAVENPLLVKAATLMLIVNGFNLLPILPLDGGWNLHALLFCRHPLMDVGFRVVACGLLIAIGLVDRLFLFLGVFLLFGVPMAYRNARIAASIGDRLLAEPEGQDIPPHAVATIVQAIRADSPASRQLPPQTLAIMTQSIYETVNTRPPGLLGTFILGALHIIAFFGAILALIVMAAVQTLAR